MDDITERLAEMLRAVTDELADEIHARYDGTRHYASEARRFERDMTSVYAARALLATIGRSATEATEQ